MHYVLRNEHPYITNEQIKAASLFIVLQTVSKLAYEAKYATLLPCTSSFIVNG